VKITIQRLRSIIREALGGSMPEESYDKDLVDDPSFKKKSVYVPDEVKKKIRSWMKDMKMSTERS